MKPLIRSAALAALVGLSALAPAYAQSGETPATIAGAKTVSTADVKTMLGKARIVDVRKKASYLDGRLPGAISIVGFYDEAQKSYDLAAFGADKSATLVVYGHGTDGWSAVRAVESAVKAGYSNVHWMRPGWAAWANDKLPIEE